MERVKVWNDGRGGGLREFRCGWRGGRGSGVGVEGRVWRGKCGGWMGGDRGLGLV